MARQIRTRSRVSQKADMKALEALMKSISTNQEIVNSISAEIKSDLETLHKMMEDAGITSHTVGTILAERFIPPGKATSYIDPEEFRRVVKDDKDFYSAIKVSITGAEKILPGKVVDSLKQITPAKPKPEQIRVIDTTERKR